MSSTSTCKFSQQKFALYVVETSSFLTHKKRRKRVASIKNYKKIKRKLMASEVRVQWYFGAKDTIPLLCFQQRYLSRWCADVHGFIQSLNLNKITIIYQRPKICNSLLIQITSLPNFPQKTAGHLNKIITEMAKPHTAAILMYLHCYVKGGLNHKLGGF